MTLISFISIFVRVYTYIETKQKTEYEIITLICLIKLKFVHRILMQS